MYLEHFQLQTSPFCEKIDPEVFSPNGDREHICTLLEDDIRSGRVFVKLIGSEGSGKTLLCKVLSGHLPEECEVIYVENPVGSFDDLLRLVCLDLGMKAGGEQVDLVEELTRQLQRRKKYGQRVVLVIDDAEKIFLATLERLLRLPCETDDLSVLTLLLAGRPGLDANLKQLTVYCTGVDIEHGYTLEPLTREETGRYLEYRLLAAGLDSREHKEIFTGEAVEKIFTSAAGNPRMTNILAEEALRKSCSDQSFLVLLDHVDTDRGESNDLKAENVLSTLFAGIKRKKKLFVGWGAVLLVLGIVFFFVTRPEKIKKDTRAHVSPTVTETVPAPVVPAVEPAPVAEAMPSVPAEKKTARRDTTVDSKQPEVKRPAPAAEEKKNIIHVQRDVVKKKLGPHQVKTVARDGDALFRDRLRASAEWLAGAYRGQYTIQLMMLSSKSAEENVKKLLVRDDYYAIIDKLHILRKKTNPPTLFVFYGTYPSMDAARQVRNTMPVFLRKHHPYALSIADALTKTED
ncbi:MAG TPA: AAA family ATPase [Desulfobulbus sp.]|nr:AAA family ATPase [Desulfobulbus sp.]